MANGLQFDIGWVQTQFPDLSNIARLSVGGQKTVLSATHPTDGDVVLKLIHPGQPNETTQREVRAVLEVKSPRVPRILDEGRIQTPTGELMWLRGNSESTGGRSERYCGPALWTHDYSCEPACMCLKLSWTPKKSVSFTVTPNRITS
jgi:hypothetical protein